MKKQMRRTIHLGRPTRGKAGYVPLCGRRQRQDMMVIDREDVTCSQCRSLLARPKKD